ncbi:unnamed protein product [Cylindrotheca closterium]|uniref:prolyl aminopeptidase n=1 Tax=Cylindrotheca closterium TaxID=2856 RepID=A0AAD2FP29_9STRA|nr:unnamed protein product [Cylindrotheca closterium]
MRKLEKLTLVLLASLELSSGAFGWMPIQPDFFVVGGSNKPIITSNSKRRKSLVTTSLSTNPNSEELETETTSEASLPGIDSARELYPQWNVLFNNGRLEVDPTHTLSYQILGKPKPSSLEQNLPTKSKGKKLVGLFLHGGPGAGCFPNHARFFDPERYYRVVLLDQRGCGKSTPTGCLTNNTLQDLVDDCERLKSHLQIPHWDVVLGGSWGTTVAIAYGQSYPKSVRSIILRGVFLFRPQEVDWLFASTGGAAKKYPTVFQSFSEAVGVQFEAKDDSADENDRAISPSAALHEHTRRLWEAPTEEERKKAARSWMQWEFFNSVAHKIPSSANLTNSNTTMEAIRSWKPPEVPPVAFTSKSQYIDESKRSWTYQSLDRRVIPPENLTLDLSNVLDYPAVHQAKFRRNISSGYSLDDPPRETVPITTPTIPYYKGQTAYRTSNSDNSNLPVQAMLTSFYSSNCDHCRNHLNLLNQDRMKQLEDIPTTIVQGGSDGICPPDSALDLLDAWPKNGTVELRMPVHGGHSMYDPLVRNELLWAVDRMADALICTKEETLEE